MLEAWRCRNALVRLKCGLTCEARAIGPKPARAARRAQASRRPAQPPPRPRSRPRRTRRVREMQGRDASPRATPRAAAASRRWCGDAASRPSRPARSGRVKPQPAHSKRMMLEVVVCADVRRRRDDGAALAVPHVDELARVIDEDERPRAGGWHERCELGRPTDELLGLLHEELRRVARGDAPLATRERTCPRGAG